MSLALQVALDQLATQVAVAARIGTPLTKTQAVAWLRAAGIPRDHARRLVTAGDGRWTVRRGVTTARRGCPPWLMLPVGAPATIDADDRPAPVDLRAWLLAAARATRFRRLEYVSGRIIPTGEAYWQRFVALADQGEVVCALRALGVPVEEGAL